MPKRKYYRKTYKRNKKQQNLALAVKAFIFCCLFFVLFCFFVFIYFAKDLPRPERFTERRLIESTQIFDSAGDVLLYEMHGEEKREFVALKDIPEHTKAALITTEDQNFYSHFGIDLKAIARAILADLKLGSPSQGASTIPQQLIRSSFLTMEKSAQRKIREIILTLELDRRYSKDQILEWYLNQVPFGSNAYGVQAASKTFFNKPIQETSVAESAALIALIRGPSYLSPFGEYKDRLLVRKDYILERMKQAGFLSPEQAEQAKKEELKFSEVKTPMKAPHFVIYLIEHYLKPKYGENLNFLRETGFRIYTSLDWELQQAAEAAIEKGAKANKSYNAHNAALVAIEPNSGRILAMVGSADYWAEPYPENCAAGSDCLFEPKFNAAVGTKNNPGRQPGSAFKPFAYVTAFKNGFSDQDIVIDEKTNFGVWGDKEYIPQNYDGRFRGEMTLRSALAQSINVPAVKVLLNLAGLDQTIETAKKLGISTLNPAFGPAIVLGGWEVKPLEMASAYAVFAAEGNKIGPVSVLKIEDAKGNIVEQTKKTPKKVLEAEPCRLLNDILSDNIARAPMFGAFSPLYFPGFQVAVKTGTTQDFRDGWTIGYTPSVATAVWVGNNNNTSMSQKPAVVLSGPIFHEFMEKALLKLPQKTFTPPEPVEPTPSLPGPVKTEN